MLLSQPTLEDFIIEKLALGSFSAKKLSAAHDAAHKPVTLQAMYKALKKLVGEGVLLKYKNEYSLNSVWRKEVISLLEQAQPFPELNVGESIMYSFKSLSQLDVYWKHIQESSLGDAPITYFYCPHQYWWFVPGRKESEHRFYKRFEEEGRQAVLLLGGSTTTDRQTRDLIVNPYVQVHTEADRAFRPTDSLTVRNDIIIQTRLPVLISGKIDEIFHRNLSEKQTEQLLKNLFSRKIPVKIKIERNANKAERFAKQIGKYFYIRPK